MVNVVRTVFSALRWLTRRSRCSTHQALVLFTAIWSFCLIYLICLFLNEKDRPMATNESPKGQQEYIDQRGIHVIVGQYIGPSYVNEITSNLTKDLLNSNNYNPIAGQGEQGLPVYISEMETQKARLMYQINRFNLVASDKISVNRTLPDPRKESCKAFAYDLSVLPATSIIIVFHNEAWSTLLRTVHSVLNRSPHHLLAEIILVDDASERLFLGIALEQYMARLQRETRIPIQILRSLKRVGLIQARLLGTRHATASVLTYLDAHVEATTGWLPPLLHRLHERPDVVISPIIDVIHEQTFAYARSVDLHWGGVNWAMHFRWFAIGSRQIERNRYINQLYLARHSQASMTQTNQSDRLFEDWLDELEQSNRSSTSSADVSTPIDLADGLVRPFKSPVMAGGLFSIRRDFFQRLGTYDPWMKVWGGENIELSLRVWSCGGRVETHPCSHVAHVFRRSSPYAFPGGVSHVLYTNLARVLHVWMEPRYQLFFYLLNEPLRNFMLDSEPDIDVIRLLQHEAFDRLLAVFSNQTRIESKLPALNQRVRLKTEHRCNGFEWFLRHVWPQSFFPLSDRFFGQLKVKANNRCAQIPTAEIGRSVGRLQLLPCDHQAYSPQLFVHGEFGSLRTDESLCVDFQSADRPRPGSILALLPCSDHDRQRWILSDGQLQHFRSRLCVRGRAAHLELVICSDHSDTTRVYGEPARWWRWAVRFDQSNSSLESNLT